MGSGSEARGNGSILAMKRDRKGPRGSSQPSQPAHPPKKGERGRGRQDESHQRPSTQTKPACIFCINPTARQVSYFQAPETHAKTKAYTPQPQWYIMNRPKAINESTQSELAARTHFKAFTHPAKGHERHQQPLRRPQKSSTQELRSEQHGDQYDELNPNRQRHSADGPSLADAPPDGVTTAGTGEGFNTATKAKSCSPQRGAQPSSSKQRLDLHDIHRQWAIHRRDFRLGK